MPRMPHPGSEVPFLDDLMAFGDGAPSLDSKVELARTIRATSPDGGRQLDRALFEQLTRMSDGLEVAEAAQHELREMLNQLDSPVWHPALFLRAVPTELGPRAMVLHGGARRVVAVADGVDLDALVAGEEVYLGKDYNVVAGRSPYGAPQVGETAFFERVTVDGRCVLRWRDEEVVVDVAGTLNAAALKQGDQVRWDRAAWMAFEKIDAAAGRRFLLEEVPDASRRQVGGQAANLETLLSALTATLVAPEKAARYALGGRRSILMVGPPGCGKTLMARVAAAEVTRLSGRRCRFGVVKPAEWESPWVGETQQNIRNCFRALREVADGSAVLFLDEIESVGRIRGGAANQHGDKFLAALLAELDGFVDRAGIAIVAATNRKDLVDPALLERLSDLEITVPRPDMRGARAIFDIHLPETVPVDAAAARDEIIETAVSHVFSPNAENALCTLRFRDGKTRTVVARELASGRMFAQICRAACQAAFLRDLRGDAPGLRVADMQQAVSEALERLASALSRQNVHAYLSDLPQDVDVVSVEPVVRKVARPHRYRHAA
ncbi:MAG: AAA family ATPase [Deltaproteobacteria bacterium]|nr:MAG: AAA family ATPase [Deltaproteobacteria bacterium]